jgi:hypothetical protein
MMGSMASCCAALVDGVAKIDGAPSMWGVWSFNSTLPMSFGRRADRSLTMSPAPATRSGTGDAEAWLVIILRSKRRYSATSRGAGTCGVGRNRGSDHSLSLSVLCLFFFSLSSSSFLPSAFSSLPERRKRRGADAPVDERPRRRRPRVFPSDAHLGRSVDGQEGEIYSRNGGGKGSPRAGMDDGGGGLT